MPNNQGDTTLEAAFRALLRDVVREVVREEMGAPKLSLERELLTYKQGAALISVSPGTLKRWVKSGRLRGFGSGRLRRVRAEDVRAALESGPLARPQLSTQESARRILATLPGRRPGALRSAEEEIAKLQALRAARKKKREP